MNQNEIKYYSINQQVFEGLLESVYQLSNGKISIMGEQPELVNIFNLRKEFEQYALNSSEESNKPLGISNSDTKFLDESMDVLDDLFSNIGELDFETIFLKKYGNTGKLPYSAKPSYEQLTTNAGINDGRNLARLVNEGSAPCMILLNNDDHSNILTNYVNSLTSALGTLGKKSFILVKGDQKYSKNKGVSIIKRIGSNKDI